MVQITRCYLCCLLTDELSLYNDAYFCKNCFKNIIQTNDSNEVKAIRGFKKGIFDVIDAYIDHYKERKEEAKSLKKYEQCNEFLVLHTELELLKTYINAHENITINLRNLAPELDEE